MSRMSYSAWWSGAYGDTPFTAGDYDDEDHTVECASCGAELPAHWEDDEDGGGLVADEACECEDEDEDGEDIDDETALSPISGLCDDIARSYKHTLGGGPC